MLTLIYRFKTAVSIATVKCVHILYVIYLHKGTTPALECHNNSKFEGPLIDDNGDVDDNTCY